MFNSVPTSTDRHMGCRFPIRERHPRLGTVWCLGSTARDARQRWALRGAAQGGKGMFVHWEHLYD